MQQMETGGKRQNQAAGQWEVMAVLHLDCSRLVDRRMYAVDGLRVDARRLAVVARWAGLRHPLQIW